MVLVVLSGVFGCSVGTRGGERRDTRSLSSSHHDGSGEGYGYGSRASHGFDVDDVLAAGYEAAEAESCGCGTGFGWDDGRGQAPPHIRTSAWARAHHLALASDLAALPASLRALLQRGGADEQAVIHDYARATGLRTLSEVLEAARAHRAHAERG